MTPMPPASETAATSSGLLHGYMAPQISGTSMPSWRVSGVSRREPSRDTYRSTVTPRQKATWSLTLAASGLGSG